MHRSAALVAVAAALLAPPPAARADRLGGNYRGPLDDAVVVREEAPPAPPAADGEGGAPTGEGGDTGGASGDGDGAGDAGDAGTTTAGGEGDSPDDDGADSGSYRGPAGEAPPDSGSRPPSSGDGGDSSDGGAGTGSGTSGSDAGSGGGEAAGAPGTATPPSGAAPTAPGPTSGSGGGAPGKKGPQDDRDRTWPFQFEGAREEYLAGVLRRRPAERLSPPRSSTGFLSTLPVARPHRVAPGATDRARALALLRERTADPDPRVRDAAYLALGKSGGTTAIPVLALAAVREPDPQVREDALLALGLAGHAETGLPVLESAVAQGGRNAVATSRAAFAALGIGLLGDADRGAPPLRETLRRALRARSQEDLAAGAATGLALLGDGESLETIGRAALDGGGTDALRSTLVHALGHYASAAPAARRGALAILDRALGARNAPVRRAAALALGAFDDAGPRLRGEGLRDPDNLVRNFSALSLGRIAARGAPGGGAALALAGDLGRAADSEVRDRTLSQHAHLALAAAAAPGHEEQVLAAAQGGFARSHDQTAAVMLLSLGLSGAGGSGTVGVLRDALGSRARGPAAQGYAALALAMAGGPDVSDRLRGCLDAPRPSAEVVRCAALGLGLAGGSEDVPVLVALLDGAGAPGISETARHFLRGTAAAALGLLDDATTLDAVAPLLQSRDGIDRAFAVVALGYLAEPDAERRVEPRLGRVFRHHDHTLALPLVRHVRSLL